MSSVWFNEEYIYRQPITLDFSTVNTVPSTQDVEIEVPKDWDLFWDTIRSDFKDVVVTDANGNVVNFSRKTGANYSTKKLVLQVDAVDVPAANCLVQYYLYYGYSSESTDRSVSTTISTPRDGFIFLGSPLNRIVDGYGLIPTSNQPTKTFIKQTTEEIDIFFSYQGLLESRVTESNSRLIFEEIDHVIVQSYDSSGSNSDSRYDLGETRFLQGYVKVRSKDGSNDTNYALSLQITTTTKQIYDIRCLIKVKDLLPS